jgi:hypothetical protein
MPFDDATPTEEATRKGIMKRPVEIRLSKPITKIIKQVRIAYSLVLAQGFEKTNLCLAML